MAEGQDPPPLSKNTEHRLGLTDGQMGSQFFGEKLTRNWADRCPPHAFPPPPSSCARKEIQQGMVARYPLSFLTPGGDERRAKIEEFIRPYLRLYSFGYSEEIFDPLTWLACHTCTRIEPNPAERSPRS